jgi:hypothetical protein
MEILTKTVLSLLWLVDIGGNVELQWLNFPLFVNIGGIVDHHCLKFLLCC